MRVLVLMGTGALMSTQPFASFFYYFSVIIRAKLFRKEAPSETQGMN